MIGLGWMFNRYLRVDGPYRRRMGAFIVFRPVCYLLLVAVACLLIGWYGR